MLVICVEVRRLSIAGLLMLVICGITTVQLIVLILDPLSELQGDRWEERSISCQCTDDQIKIIQSYYTSTHFVRIWT